MDRVAWQSTVQMESQRVRQDLVTEKQPKM